MQHLEIFFNTRIESQHRPLWANLLNQFGNLGLTPVQFLRHGRTVICHLDVDNIEKITRVIPSFHPVQSMLKTILAIIFLVPGLLLAPLKALSYLSSDIRAQHNLVKRYFNIIADMPAENAHLEEDVRANNAAPAAAAAHDDDRAASISSASEDNAEDINLHELSDDEQFFDPFDPDVPLQLSVAPPDNSDDIPFQDPITICVGRPQIPCKTQDALISDLGVYVESLRSKKTTTLIIYGPGQSHDAMWTVPITQINALKPKKLILRDVPFDQDILKKSLESMGFTKVDVNSEEEALSFDTDSSSAYFILKSDGTNTA